MAIPYRVIQARRRLYATDAQINYLRILLNRAFVLHINHGLCHDANHLDRVFKADASNSIATLKRLIAEKEGKTNA